MGKIVVECDNCGFSYEKYLNPAPTVDIIVYDEILGVVLIERKNEPFGYAIPGGFIDYGEYAEHAAVREALEETNLKVELIGLLGVYSEPTRDIRSHTMSVVYVAKCLNVSELMAQDDAKSAAFFKLDALPDLAFDHGQVMSDFIAYLKGGRNLTPLTYNSPILW